jgi:hypothetical protein
MNTINNWNGLALSLMLVSTLAACASDASQETNGQLEVQSQALIAGAPDVLERPDVASSDVGAPTAPAPATPGVADDAVPMTFEMPRDEWSPLTEERPVATSYVILNPQVIAVTDQADTGGQPNRAATEVRSALPASIPLSAAERARQRELVPQEFHAHPDFGYSVPGDPEGSVELLEMRTGETRTLQLADGEREMIGFPGGNWMPDANGFLVDIFYRLRLQGEQLQISSPLGATGGGRSDLSEGLTIVPLTGRLDQMTVMRAPTLSYLDQSGRVLSEQPLRFGASEDGDSLRFADSAADVSMLLAPRRDGFSQTVVLDESWRTKAAGAFSVQVATELEVPAGLEVRVGTQLVAGAFETCDDIELVDSSGLVVFRVTPAVVYDARDLAFGRTASGCPTQVSLAGALDGSTLRIALSVRSSYLTDPERQYPVTIDPDYVFTREAYWTQDLFGTLRWDQGAKLMGNAVAGWEWVLNALFQWPIDGLPYNAFVYGADLTRFHLDFVFGPDWWNATDYVPWYESGAGTANGIEKRFLRTCTSASGGDLSWAYDYNWWYLAYNFFTSYTFATHITIPIDRIIKQDDIPAGCEYWVELWRNYEADNNNSGWAGMMADNYYWGSDRVWYNDTGGDGIVKNCGGNCYNGVKVYRCGFWSCTWESAGGFSVYLGGNSGARANIVIRYRLADEYCRDNDGDGYGNGGQRRYLPGATAGWSLNCNDCNDGNGSIYPGAPEVCDYQDSNCNGTDTDEARTLYYYDFDNDGWGVGSPQSLCAPSGYYRARFVTDCNDNNNTIYPGASEVIGDNIDQNCNGREFCYYDTDNDGYRRADNASFESADADCNDSGEALGSEPGGDCNDNNFAIKPGATEGVGDQIDQNCDGAEICYLDADNDGYARNDNATVNSPNTSCNDSGEARNDEPRNDCNDSNALIYPGRAELCDFVDNNCNNLIDEGFSVGAVCDDADADSCNDGITVCAANGLSSVCENTGAGVYYPVNTTGVSTLADWSGNSITASLTQVGAGALPTVIDETSTNARGVNLDGVNDMVEIPNNQFINSTRGWSTAMWVRPESVECDGNNNWRWLATRGAGIADGPNLILEENNALAFSINVGGTVHRQWTVGGFVPSYVWTHVAFTYDANTGVANAYRNGALYHTWNLPAGSVIQVANPFRIGNWGSNVGCPNGAGAYDGMVDDIYITGRSMSAADVATLYGGQSFGTVVNAEICDGVNNDCIGGADDASSGIPSGWNFTNPGQTCEGTDADGCNEGGLTYCYADSLGSYCGDGPSAVLGANPFYGGLARDISGWNNHAAIAGATWDAGQSAIYFDGVDDYLSITPNTSLYTPAGYTMELWARPQTDSDYWTGIMGQERGRSRYQGNEASPRGMHMWFGNSNQQDGPNGFIHHTYGCFNNFNYAQNGYSVPINAGGFTHIVVTMDARGRQQVYINGALVADNPSCGMNLGASIAGIPIVVGRNLDGGASNYFKGWMRNIAIYPYAIPATKVASNFALGRQPDLDRNFELCDGLNNDCAGAIDDPYAGLGAACDGIDGDLCNEGVIACAADQYSSVCNDNTGTNAEICDSNDNNCNGVIDENLPLQTYYRDADNDNFGDPQRSTQTCSLTAPGGYRSNSADCSDATALVRPGAAERCNGFDDNCNASTDEANPQGGGACVADALGICANGTQFCPGPSYFTPDNDGFIRNWLLLGPFAGTGCSETPNPPFVPASLIPEPGVVTNGSTWTAFNGYTSGCGVSCGGGGVDFDCVYGDRNNSTVFAYAHVYSPVARAAQLRIGSDDASKVWLNGSAIAMGSETLCRGCGVDQNIQNVNLNAGWNSVLIGVSEGGGGWAMSLRFTATDGLPMRDLRVSYEPAGALECAPGQPVLVGGVPGELCNGLDDDCNGSLDGSEVDNDGDGYNECAGGDCDDADVYIYPSAPDRCDGKVNNCSGASNPDPSFDVGAICDGSDPDLCTDGVKICAPTQLSTICRNTGPVRGFDFRNGSGTTVSDTSGSGLNGTLTGYATPDAAWLANGRYGTALTFNGLGERVSVPTTGLNNRNGSIEFWMRPGFTAEDTTARGFFETDSGINTSNWISLFEWTNNYIYFRMGSLGGCCNNDLTIPSTGLLANGTWSHWVATWEDRGAGSSIMRVFVNGTLVGERANATFDGPAIHSTGSLGRGHGMPFLGAMDEVAFYDYPLSPANVALRYADTRLAPIGVNHEFCDGLDNDCDLQTDEALGLGAFCDGPDADNCSDARQICAANTIGTQCSVGAGAVIRFNDNLSDLIAFDSSGNNNHALLSLNTASVTVGSRTALDLFKSRNSRAQIPSTAAGSTEFTFAAWIRPSTSTTDTTEALVSRSSSFATTNCDANGFAVWTSGRIWLQCQNFVSTALETRMDLLGQWTHVAVTYDRGSLRVYVNGTLADTRSFAGDEMREILWNSDIWLGQDQDAPNALFEDADAFFGSIDDAVWYGHPLPAADIATLASTGVPNLDVNYEFCDLLDNDCKSGVDDTHVPPLGDACTVGLGICAAPGYRICAADGFGTVCDGVPGTPGVESCNGLDDDCDGGVDENWPEIGATCTVGVGACARTGVYFCSGDGSGVACSASPGVPTTEVCDNVDNDCDGNTDEGPTGTPLVIACYPGDAADLLVAPAACRAGTATCIAGAATGCTGYVLPSAEQCDPVDWDCDGAINDGFDVGSACTNGQLGECLRNGVTVCSTLSATACDAPTVVPGIEVCGDSLDNDCDGEADEGTVSATITVDAVNSGVAGFDYSTCDITDGSPTTCSAVRFTVTVAPTSTYGVPTGSPIELTLDAALPITLSSGLTLPRTVAPGRSDTFTYCWDNAAAREDAVVVVEIDSGCNLLSSDPDATTPADLAECGPEDCDGDDNDGDGRVDELPDACFGNPTLSCVNDRDVFSCVPTLEDGTPECTGDGCTPSGDGFAGGSDDEAPAEAGQAASADGEATGQAGCSATRVVSLSPVLLALVPLLVSRRRRLLAA